MKKIVFLGMAVILLLGGIQFTVYSYDDSRDYKLTPTLRLLDDGTTSLDNYGTATLARTLYYNQQYKYMLITRTTTIVNSSNSPMQAVVYLPYLYIYGLNDTDNSSYANIGYPAYWDSQQNKFFFENYVTNGGFILEYDSDKVTLEYPLRKDLKDAAYFINDMVYQQGELADWSSNVPVVRQLASAAPDDTVIAFDAGTIAPQESKSFTYVIKSYGLPDYRGVTGVDYETYLRYEVSGKPVRVRFVDQDGNAIADEEVINADGSALVNEAYTTTAKNIDGYRLAATPDNQSGVFTDQEQTVTYVYGPLFQLVKGQVIVSYQDTAGNALIEPTILEDNLGNQYHTSAKAITGWELQTIQGNQSGIFTEADQYVQYIYQPATAVQTLPNTGNDEALLTMVGMSAGAIGAGCLLLQRFRRK